MHAVTEHNAEIPYHIVGIRFTSPTAIFEEIMFAATIISPTIICKIIAITCDEKIIRVRFEPRASLIDP